MSKLVRNIGDPRTITLGGTDYNLPGGGAVSKVSDDLADFAERNHFRDGIQIVHEPTEDEVAEAGHVDTVQEASEASILRGKLADAEMAAENAKLATSELLATTSARISELEAELAQAKAAGDAGTTPTAKAKATKKETK